MKKKTYVIPSIKTMEMETQGCLLAASENYGKDATVEKGRCNGFDDDWE